MSLRETCKCGHDKATHFFDVYGPGDCLGARCDCKCYRNEHEPDVPPAPDTDRCIDGEDERQKPHTNTSCSCPACTRWLMKRWGGWV